MEPRCILQVSTHDVAGGAERVAWNLFRAYRALGRRSWLAVGEKHSSDPGVLPIPNPLEENPWAAACCGLAALLEPLDGLRLGAGALRVILKALANPRKTAALRAGRDDFNFPGTYRLLDLPPERPDLVHCHNLHGGYFDLRALPWLSRRAPLVLTLHDGWLIGGRWETRFGEGPFDGARGASSSLSLRAEGPSTVARRPGAESNHRRRRAPVERSRLYLAAPSSWLMRDARRSGLHGRMHKVIPNGIDLNLFRPADRARARAALSIPQDALVILFSAHNRFKDHDLMEAALARLAPPAGRELLFICLGREGPARPLGRGRTTYAGMVRDPARVATHYAAADCFLHAAHEEAFGLMITEAMASGIPPVATAVGGVPEQVADGRTGLLTPPGDADALAKALATLIERPDLRAAMGRRAAEEARARYDANRQARDYLEWYEEVLQDWRRFPEGAS